MKTRSLIVLLSLTLGIVFAFPSFSHAAACSATSSGNWSNGANWTGCTGAGGVPATGDTITINSGVIIVLDTAATVSGTTINGTLNTNSTSNFAFTTGTLSIGSTGALIANASTITLNGTTGTLFSITTGGTFTYGTSTVIMNPDAAVTLTSGTVPFYNLTLSPTLTTARAYTFGSTALTINNNFVVNPTAASALTLTVNLGAATTVTGTVLLEHTTNGTGLLETTSASHFNLTAGNLDLEAGGRINANTSTITLTGTVGTLLVNNSGTYSGASSSIVASGDGNVTFIGGSTSIQFSNLTFSPTITTDRTYTIGNGISAMFGNFTIQPNATTTHTLTVNMSGTLSYTGGLILRNNGSSITVFDTTSNNYALTIGSINIGNVGNTLNANGSVITITNSSSGTNGFKIGTGTFNYGTSTVVMNGDGSSTVTSGTSTFYNLTFSPTITAARAYTFGTNTVSIANNFTINPTASSTFALTVNLGSTTTVGGTTSVGGSSSATSTLDTVSASNFTFSTGSMTITNTGTFKAQGSTVTVTGNWTNNGTFTAGTSVVTFSGSATATVSGASTFYTLSIAPSSVAKEVDFSSSPSDIITVTNIFSVRGSSGNLVTLHSTSAGNQWHLLPTGTATADWVAVKDGGCEAGAVSISAADYTNQGNNSSCWTSVASLPFGTVYYVDPSGSDSNTGTSSSSPWQTLTKINTTTFQPGDQILFKKGGTWSGQLTTSTAGSSTHPITYGTYGSGAAPVITSLTTVSSWTADGGGIYEAVCTSCGSSLNMVTVNGSEVAIGRYPNADAANGGYLAISSHSGTTSITSSALSSSPNWTGATVAIRTTHWNLDPRPISSHSGTTITYTGGTTAPTDGNGFFIENSPSTLDQFGEWYYNSSNQTLQMYFGANNPSSYTVQAATLSNLATISKNYITIDGLSFQGALGTNVSVASTTGDTIQNSAIAFSGTNGLQLTSTTGFSLLNSTISDSNNNGINTPYASTNTTVTIKNNTINRSGVIPGMGIVGNIDGIQINGGGNNNFFDVEQNIVTNSGYNGIAFSNNDGVVINNNYVDTFNTVTDDGGGIYCGPSQGTYTTRRQVESNIVVNGIGAPLGTADSVTYKPSEGIYLDQASNDVIVTGNTISNVADAGIFMNSPSDVIVTNNTIFGSGSKQLWIGNTPVPSSLTITGNTFFSTTGNYSATILTATTGTTVANYGTFDNNKFIHPNNITNILSPNFNSASYTLAQWKSTFGVETNSQDITYPSSTTYQVFTNATTGTVSQALTGTFSDISGNSFTNTVSIPAYGSVVLTQISGVSDTTAPSVSVSAPTVGATVGGSAVTFTATASDNVAVASVQFAVDGTLVGSPITSAPYTYIWNSTGATNSTHTITAVAIDTSNNSTTSSGVSVTVDNAAPVISSIAAGIPGQTSITITWSTNKTADSQVEYGLTTSYGSSSTLAASLVTTHSVTLSGLTAGTTYHYRVKSTAFNGVQTISGDQTFATSTSPDTTAPSVSVTAPILNGTFSSTTTFTATASDNIGVTSLQFAVDGTLVGSAITNAPYTYTWDTTTVADGAHIVTAIARDAAGNSTTSSGVAIIVLNNPIVSGGGGGGGGGGSSSGGTTVVSTGGGGGGSSATPVDTTTTVTLPVGCTLTTLFSAVTGLPCTTTTSTNTSTVIPEGCLGTTAFSALNGQRCPNFTGTATSSTPSGTVGIVSEPITITQTLSVGSKSSQVMLLQHYLNIHGFTVAVSGAGSLNNETTYFGPATKAAVQKFQAAYGITPVSGLVGPKTRSVLAGAGLPTVSVPTATTPPSTSSVQKSTTPVTTVPKTTTTTTSTSSTSTSSTTTISQHVIVITQNLSVHASASTTSTTIDIVSYGTKGTAVAKNSAGTMYRVLFSTGVTGWVSKQYLTVY